MSSTVSKLVSSVCKKIIKPYSPTPISLRCHKLSFLDQIICCIHTPVVLFYPKLSNTWSNKPSNYISQHLEKSLSKVLTNYYPLAGELNDNISVDCNDNGVEFFTTKIDCPMSQILNDDPYADKHNIVYPNGVPNAYSYKGSLAVFQLSHFNCGGIAISVCFSHKIDYGYTLCNFTNHWATIARNPMSSEILSMAPQFNGASYFPPIKEDLSQTTFIPELETEKYSIKSFSFSSSKLTALKARVINQSEVQNPTDTEVVSAFIYQRAMATKNVVTSTLHHALSLRPPLPKNTMGNNVSPCCIHTKDEKEMNLPQIVGKLRKAKEELRKKYKNAQPNEFVSIAQEALNETIFNGSSSNFYMSSTTKFPIYDVDFGWGKPEKVCIPLKNMFMLMDNKNRDGVEVISGLKEQDMLAFERDEELLQFASPSS